MLAPGTDTRVDFERGMRTAPPLILLLIAANVALFAWELAAGALASRESIVEAGALVRDRVLAGERSEEHTSELQSPCNLVCRLLLEKKKKKKNKLCISKSQYKSVTIVLW